jgi:hypothetical protein
MIYQLSTTVHSIGSGLFLTLILIFPILIIHPLESSSNGGRTFLTLNVKFLIDKRRYKFIVLLKLAS